MYPPEVTSCYAPKVRGIYYPATDTYEDLDAMRARIVDLTTDLAETERERQKAVEREAKTARQVELLSTAYADAMKQRDDTSLPTPDCDNPAHCRFVADMAVALGGDPDLGDEVNADNVDFWRCRAVALEHRQQADADDVLRAEVEKTVTESTDLVIDLIHSFANLTDVDAAKASMRPAIRDAVDAVLADLRAAERGES